MTLRDITKVTGFTVNTVSRALKGKGDISLGTRRLIQREAEKLGYIPNALAASLRSGRTRTISVIIPDISDPLFAILVRDIDSKLKEGKFDLFIQNTDEDDVLERRAVMASIGKKIDGVIICPCQKDPGNLSLLKNNQVPFVLLGQSSSRPASATWLPTTSREAFWPPGTSSSAVTGIFFSSTLRHVFRSARERLQGYRKALASAGIPFRAKLVREVAIRGGECARALQGLMTDRARFTAVFCFSDLMAWEAICFLQEHGLRIPADVAVVGFDDIQSRLSYPYPLTSVGYGKQKIAFKSVDALMKLIEHPDGGEPTRLVVPVELSVRMST